MKNFLPALLVAINVLVQIIGAGLPIGGSAPVAGGSPTFTAIQNCQSTVDVTAGTTMSCVFGSNPTSGNAVVCAAWVFPGPNTVSSWQDTNSNAYTVTSPSPSDAQTGARSLFMSYYLTAAANADKTITITVGTALTFNSNIRCEEFHRSSGTWAFDTAPAAGSSAGSSTMNAPSITPAAAGGLLVSAAGSDSGAIVTSVNSPWTQAGNNSVDTHDELSYVLSASSGATSPNVTLSGSASWNGLSLALK